MEILEIETYVAGISIIPRNTEVLIFVVNHFPKIFMPFL